MIKVSFTGIEPWTAFHIGLSNFSLTIGIWTLLIQFIFIFLTYLMDKKRPGIGTFLNMACIGPLIDFFVGLDLYPDFEHNIFAYLFLILGIFISSLGAAIGIKTNLGPGAKTNFYIVLSEKINISISKSKTSLEVLGIILALILKGPLFLGTVIFAFISGPLIQFYLSLFKKINS